MWGRSGESDKPQVKLKVRSLRQLKKWAKEPKCLRCGYDLRGQHMANGDTCSECGQACRYEDLADQVAGQRAGFVPVIRLVVRRALDVWFCLIPLMCFRFIFMLTFGEPILQSSPSPVQSTSSMYEDWPSYLAMGIPCLIWLAVAIWQMAAVCKLFGLIRGCVIVVLSHVRVAVYLVSLVLIVYWGIQLLSYILYLLDGYLGLGLRDHAFASIWQHLALLVGIVLLLANRWWSSKFIITPCRQRCRELTLQYLVESAADLESSIQSQG